MNKNKERDVFNCAKDKIKEYDCHGTVKSYKISDETKLPGIVNVIL